MVVDSNCIWRQHSSTFFFFSLSEGRFMGSSSSKTPIYWQPDTSRTKCDMCDAEFSVFRRRHHCRSCGGLFCDECSSSRCTVPARGLESNVRVCSICFLKLENEKALSSQPVTPIRRKSDMAATRQNRLNAPNEAKLPISVSAPHRGTNLSPDRANRPKPSVAYGDEHSERGIASNTNTETGMRLYLFLYNQIVFCFTTENVLCCSKKDFSE